MFYSVLKPISIHDVYAYIIIVGYVYFSYGKKHPIMIFEGFEYVLKSAHGTKSIWRCNKEHRRCKARVMSAGQTITIKSSAEHNHPPSFKGDVSKLKGHSVWLKYASSFS